MIRRFNFESLALGLGVVNSLIAAGVDLVVGAVGLTQLSLLGGNLVFTFHKLII